MGRASIAAARRQRQQQHQQQQHRNSNHANSAATTTTTTTMMMTMRLSTSPSFCATSPPASSIHGLHSFSRDGSVHRRRSLHSSSSPRSRFSFDTAAFVSRLEQEGGLSRKQSAGLVEALEAVVEESIRTMTANLVTRAEQEKHQYTQKVDFAKLKSEITLLEKQDFSLLKSENERLLSEVERLKQRLREGEWGLEILRTGSAFDCRRFRPHEALRSHPERGTSGLLGPICIWAFPARPVFYSSLFSTLLFLASPSPPPFLILASLRPLHPACFNSLACCPIFLPTSPYWHHHAAGGAVQ